MALVKKGNKVKIFYTGKFKDGTVFESNVGQAPLEFIVGKGKVIKGFETGVIGMSLGQTKTVTIKPVEGYGAKDPVLIWTVADSEFPPNILLELGRDVAFTRHDGTAVEGWITKIEEGRVTVDGNHPLSGRNLTFEIKLVGMS